MLNKDSIDILLGKIYELGYGMTLSKCCALVQLLLASSIPNWRETKGARKSDTRGFSAIPLGAALISCVIEFELVVDGGTFSTFHESIEKVAFQCTEIAQR